LGPTKFKVAYDKLVFACGAEALTFGIRGVTEHAIFLREVHHAQEIRRRLLLNLMLSDVPGMAVLFIGHLICANQLKFRIQESFRWKKKSYLAFSNLMLSTLLLLGTDRPKLCG